MAKAIKAPGVRVRVTMREIEPPIWREFVRHWHLGQFHVALQIAFGWYEEHLHCFVVGDRTYGVPGPYDDETEREALVRLHEVLQAPGDVITYWYDFGDDWFLDAVVEEVLETQSEARCVDGRRAGPPDDSGGPWGYMDKLEVLADPDHEDYAEVADWLGVTYDPELIDLPGIDAAVRRLS